MPTGWGSPRNPTASPGALATAASWARFVFPHWVGGAELLGIAAGVLLSLLLLADLAAVAREGRG